MRIGKGWLTIVAFALAIGFVSVSRCNAEDISPELLTLMRTEAAEPRAVPSIDAFGPSWCGNSHMERQAAIKQLRLDFSSKIKGSPLEKYFPASIQDGTFPVEDLTKYDYDRFLILAKGGAVEEYLRLYTKAALAKMDRYQRYIAYWRTHPEEP